ncbi:class II glutamine amidotransferase [Geodermatophilus sp. URMC 64]
MCRLLGWAARVPTSLLDLLGEEDLDAFTELSCKHADGWGLARSTRRGVEVRKQADAARSSAEFADRARNGSADLGLAHLRWATLGLSVRRENTHPFTDGRVAFAHNGSIKPPGALDRLLPRRARRRRRGDTDSERFFLAVHSRMREGAAPGDALAGTVAEIAATTEFTSLNCLLLTADALYAVSRVNTAASQEFDEGPDYYDLRYRVTDDAVVVASSGWGRDWQELANGDLLVVRRGTLETEVRSIDELVPAA